MEGVGLLFANSKVGSTIFKALLQQKTRKVSKYISSLVLSIILFTFYADANRS